MDYFFMWAVSGAVALCLAVVLALTLYNLYVDIRRVSPLEKKYRELDSKIDDLLLTVARLSKEGAAKTEKIKELESAAVADRQTIKKLESAAIDDRQTIRQLTEQIREKDASMAQQGADFNKRLTNMQAQLTAREAELNLMRRQIKTGSLARK